MDRDERLSDLPSLPSSCLICRLPKREFTMASFSSMRSEVFSRETRRQHYGSHIMGLNAYDRHKKFMYDYVHHYQDQAPPADSKLLKTDMDTLRETYRFVRTEEDDKDTSWEKRLAKRYYDKLFKEYCIADMSRYKESKIGLRWRSEKEVVSGKGQFICGSKTCDEREALRSYEVNFAYTECGENRQALVKVRVCPRCTYKLNYRKEKEIQIQLERQKRKRDTRRRERKSRGSSKSSVPRERSDEDSESEDSMSSGGPESDDSEQKLAFNATRARGVRDPRLDKGTIMTNSQPSQQEHGKEEFEQFFEGMFL